MQVYDIAILAIFGFSALFILSLRTNVALAILALCAGFMFNTLITDELVAYIYQNNYNRGSLPIAAIVSIVLINIPPFLVLYRFRGRQKSRWLQHLFPIIAYLILSVLFTIQNVTPSFEADLVNNSRLANYLFQYDLVIAVGVVAISLLDILIFDAERNRKFNKMKKKTKKKHRD